ncbi:MAG TPA: glycosyltransferase [Planctomycetes bacterium]|nr:glycosyltransferase [Planctomycetota bacterium]
MDLAFALFRYFPFGGMQRDMLGLAERAARIGNKVTIYCHTWDGVRPEGIDVCVLDAPGRTNHTRARRFNDALRERLASADHKLVFGFDKLGGLDMYFTADPCFVTRTANRSWLYRLTPRYRTFRDLEGRVFGENGSKRIFLLDEGQKHDYQQIWKTPDARFQVLQPGIAMDRRKGDDAAALRASGRQELGADDNTLVLLMLAANFELKGLDRAMHAVAELPAQLRARTRLLAIGQSPPPQLQQLANRLDLQDHVTMLPGRSDVPRLLQSADLLIHPARRDTTATVLLEAVVAELPVLCTDTCGYAKHIEAAACGRVVAEPFCQETLNENLRELLMSDLTSLQTAARNYHETHDLHGMQEYLCEMFDSLAHTGYGDLPLAETRKS